jgi:hypothetical protein
MKTEQLIDLLAADASPVDTAAHARRMGWALVAGTAAAATTAGLAWGWRSFDAQDLSEPMLWVRWAYCLAIIIVAWQAMDRLARPGQSLKALPWRIGVPLGLIAVLGLAQITSAFAGDRLDLLMGSSALQCPTNIAAVSVPVFIISLWVMRRMAPTRPALAGAAAGLLAGGVGALGYTFHCTELAAPFVAVWYTLGMAIPTLAGAIIGARLLRW